LKAAVDVSKQVFEQREGRSENQPVEDAAADDENDIDVIEEAV